MDDIYSFFSEYISDFISSDRFVIGIIADLIIFIIIVVIISVNRSSKRRNYNQQYTHDYNNPQNAQINGVYFYPDLSANRHPKKYKTHKGKKSGMILLLSVPYEEKNEAKKNGAWWNRDLKKWYVSENPRQPYYLKWNNYFRKWLPKHNLLCRDLYIFKMYRQCRKCGKFTPVICLASKDAYTLFDGKDFDERYQSLQLLSYVKNIPCELATYLKEHYRYYPSLSKDNKEPYFNNHCLHCTSVQDDFYLHELPEEAFYRYLCHRDFDKSNYYKVNNKYLIPIFAKLPYYDLAAHSSELMLIHMKTEIENRASLNVTQNLIDRLFDDSNFLGEIEITGI